MKTILTDEQALARIKELQAECKAFQDMPYHPDLDAKMKRMKEFETHLSEFQEQLGPGLRVGKELQFSVADGYALYFVTKVGPRSCTVEHIDFLDGYASDAVWNNKIPTAKATAVVRWRDGLKAMFGRKS